MKATKKIVGAACALVAAVALSAGSTFAWFAMNNSVTATGMQVDVKTENTYLLISSSKSTASDIQSDGLITTPLTVSDAEAKVLPCKPKEASEIGDGKIFATEGNTAVTSYETASTWANWYTANGTTTSDGSLKAGTATSLTGFSGYVIEKTVYLTVAAGANAANNLKVSATITKKASGTTMTAVKVLVTTDDGGFATLTTTNNSNIDIKGTNTNLTDNTVRTVKIYIYYDGSDNSVYTNNVVNLSGATITLSFTVDAVPST